MKVKPYDLILAFYPHARGFAYAVFEGPRSPVDWGMSDVSAKQKAQRCLRRLSLLLDQYRPDALLVREVSGGRTMKRIVHLLAAIDELAESRGVLTVALSRKQVQAAFAYLGSPTRNAIVEAIAKHIPILAPYVPPIRKIWNGEDRRMALFDAAALALSYFNDEEIVTPAASI